MQKENIDNQIFKKAFEATVKKRGTEEIIKNYKPILDTVVNSPAMLEQWKRYQKEFEYAKDIMFEDTCRIANTLMKSIF